MFKNNKKPKLDQSLGMPGFRPDCTLDFIDLEDDIFQDVCVNAYYQKKYGIPAPGVRLRCKDSELETKKPKLRP